MGACLAHRWRGPSAAPNSCGSRATHNSTTGRNRRLSGTCLFPTISWFCQLKFSLGFAVRKRSICDTTPCGPRLARIRATPTKRHSASCAARDQNKPRTRVFLAEHLSPMPAPSGVISLPCGASPRDSLAIRSCGSAPDGEAPGPSTSRRAGLTRPSPARSTPSSARPLAAPRRSPRSSGGGRRRLPQWDAELRRSRWSEQPKTSLSLFFFVFFPALRSASPAMASPQRTA